MKLTKEQKIIVLCSLIYVIFIYLAADVHLKHNDDMLRFMIFTIPVWGYWSGVWIYGFGWLEKLWCAIRGFVYALLLIVIVGGIAVSVYKGIKTRILEELRVQHQTSQKQVVNRKLTKGDEKKGPVKPDGFSFVPIEDDFDPWKIKSQHIEKDEENEKKASSGRSWDDFQLVPVEDDFDPWKIKPQHKEKNDEGKKLLNAPVGDVKDEYRETSEALEYELRRIRNINSD